MIDLLKPIVNRFSQVIVLGYGREGKSTYRLLRRLFPELPLTVADANMAVETDVVLAKDALLNFSTGVDYLKVLNEKALVFKSPGVKIPKNVLHPESVLTSQTDLFIQKYHGQMIGISGTKGKSTTSSLVTHLLKRTGREAVLLGNIGVPAFDKLDEINPKTWIIFELSAHQLQHVKHSPYIAILLNIFPEHLDYFDSFESYRQAKLNLFRFQNENDFLIIPNTLQRDILYAKGNVLNFTDKKAVNAYSWFNSTNFNIDGRTYLFPELHLKGQHNKSNVVAAMIASYVSGVAIDEMIRILPEFKGLYHRLEYVGEKGGVKFYNDSISTIPASTMAGIEALGEVSSLILGGFDRGLDYSELVVFLESTEIRSFAFLGDAGRRMMKIFKSDFEGELYAAETFEQAFYWVQKHTPTGKICLLSPAAASYDEFHNFEHRGDTFKQLVMRSY